MRDETDSYDIIIIGGGSAGCVLASRLSKDPGRRVLLIEAGSDYVPGKEPRALSDPGARAFFKSEYFWPGLMHELVPADEAGAGGFSLPFLQARVLGGGSSINGMHAQRGIARDYEEWQAFGVEGWGWEDVLPYFNALETDLDFPGASHGNDGPIKISRVPESKWSPLSRSVRDAFVGMGVKAVKDFNSDVAEGVGPVPISADGTRRMSTAQAYLDAKTRNRPNLEILAETTVTRLLFDGARVIGVQLDAANGNKKLNAGETIVCCGAIHSPALLLRSGIGPAEELSALGIDVQANRPGVGRNLGNHPIMSMSAHLVRGGRARDTAGPPSSVIARYSSGLEGCPSSDMVLTLWERVPSAHYDDPLGRQIADFMFILNKPFSTGRVTLNSKDPQASPIVRFNLLSDTRDLERMKRAVRKGLELMGRQEVASWINMSFLLKPTPILFRYLKDDRIGRYMSALGAVALSGPAKLTRRLLQRWTTPIGAALSDDEIEAIVRANISAGGHPSGTCRLGNAADELAVVDAECKVIGVEGLRVVDASIFPTLMTAGTNIPVIMAAEKCAAQIRSDARGMGNASHVRTTVLEHIPHE